MSRVRPGRFVNSTDQLTNYGNIQRQFETRDEALESATAVTMVNMDSTFTTSSTGTHDQLFLRNPGFDVVYGVTIGRLKNNTTNADSTIDAPQVNWQWTADGDVVVTRLGNTLANSTQYTVTFLVSGRPSNTGRVGKKVRGD